jgi:hypothetical protein
VVSFKTILSVVSEDLGTSVEGLIVFSAKILKSSNFVFARSNDLIIQDFAISSQIAVSN